MVRRNENPDALALECVIDWQDAPQTCSAFT
jgi:hypothetical protein